MKIPAEVMNLLRDKFDEIYLPWSRGEKEGDVCAEEFRQECIKLGVSVQAFEDSLVLGCDKVY